MVQFSVEKNHDMCDNNIRYVGRSIDVEIICGESIHSIRMQYGNQQCILIRSEKSL